MAVSTLLMPESTVYPLHKPAKSKGQANGDTRPFQYFLPLFQVNHMRGEDNHVDQLFQVLWEVIRSRLEGDGLLITCLEGVPSEVNHFTYGFYPQPNGSDLVETVARWVSTTGQPLMFSRGAWLAPETSLSLKQLGLASVLGVPLIDDGEKLGVAVALRAAPKPSFTGKQLEFLYLLGWPVAAALNHLRLMEEVKRQRVKVEWLKERTLALQEGERRRMCLDLHDGVAQWIIAAHHRIQTFDRYLLSTPEASQKLVELGDMLEQGLTELRWLMGDPYPQTGEAEIHLPPVLLQLISKLSQATGIHSHFGVVGELRSMSTAQQLSIYRIVQEALNNVRKHARARDVNVQLHFVDSELNVTVEDNGQGFDISRTLNHEGCGRKLGLSGMRERAETLGGSLNIWSQPGQGTRIGVRLPLGQTEHPVKVAYHP